MNRTMNGRVELGSLRVAARSLLATPVYSLTVAISLAVGVAGLSLGYAALEAAHARTGNRNIGASVVIHETTEAACRQCVDVFSVETYGAWGRAPLGPRPWLTFVRA